VISKYYVNGCLVGFLDATNYTIKQFESFFDTENLLDKNIPNIKRYKQFLAGRILLQETLLSFNFNPNLANNIVCNDQGKPYIPGSDFRFNISHSDQFIVIAASISDNVGIDIESTKQKKDITYLRKYCITNQELDCGVFGLQSEDVLRAWIIKESILKCAGLGLTYNIRQLSVNCTGRDHYCSTINDKEYLSVLRENSKYGIALTREIWSR